SGPHMKLRSLLPCILLLIPACSSSPGDSTATDAGTDAAQDAGHDAANDAATDAPQACNALVNGAPTIPIDQVASEPPLPQGGTVVDGTYWLTAVVIYTGASGPTGASGTGQTT